MKKTCFTLLAILFVFSANTNAWANSQNRSAGTATTRHSLDGFQAENGVTVELVSPRYGIITVRITNLTTNPTKIIINILI